MNSERSKKTVEGIKQSIDALTALLSTSYGPKGLDKMIIKDNKTIVTNDGATIMWYYRNHPIHRILSDISMTQDTNCGDGTTSVILLTGSISKYIFKLRENGMHPCYLVNSLKIAKKLALEYLESIKIPVEKDRFRDIAVTALNSKISEKSVKTAEIAIEALERTSKKNLKIIKQQNGSIDDIQIINGLVIESGNHSNLVPGEYKAMVIQFCISSPKPNMDSKIVINDAELLELFVKEEKEYIVEIVKTIKKTGANLLFVQKSLLRESCSDLAKFIFKKLGILVVDKIERDEIEIICKKLNISPVSDIEFLKTLNRLKNSERNIEGVISRLNFTEEDLIVKINISNPSGFIAIDSIGTTVILNGCDKTVTDEAERSFNDVVSVLESLKTEPYILPGGGSIETGIAKKLESYVGEYSLGVHEIAEGFLAMPHILIRNSGMPSTEIISLLERNVTENSNLGISLKEGVIFDMVNDENIIQPLAVSKSMVSLSIETVSMLVRIDDILPARE